MFFNAVKAILLLSAADLAIGALSSPRRSIMASKRHWGSDASSGCNNCQGGFNSYDGYGGGFAQAQGDASVGVGASAGLNAMVQGWASLTPAFQKLRGTFSSGASVDVALQAAVALRAQVQSVSTQYKSCGCSASSQSSAAFQQMAVQFFASMQAALEIGQQTYGSAWGARFTPVFQQYSTAFVSLKAIAASIQVDLAAVLKLAHINVQLFAAVGLNLSALLQLNLSVGGLLHL